MSRFTRLAVGTVAATLLLIAAGGIVRALEAGLGCPDWPTCHGSLNPPSSLAAGPFKLAWIEHSHRLLAALVIGLIVVLAVAARRTGQPRPVRIATLLLVPAVLSQAVIGAFVVWLKLDAQSVLLHLGGALTVLGLAVFVAVHPVARPSRLAVVASAVTVVQMLLGSAVTGWSAGLAYGTFPSYNGRVLPPAVRNTPQWLHVAHRSLALVVVGLVVAVWLTARRDRDVLVRRAALLAVVLVGVQVFLGAGNIWWDLSAWTVAPHLAVGSWIVTALYVVTLRRSAAPALRLVRPVADELAVAS